MTIDPRLHRIVGAQPYPLLFATISGAHLYGFPSPDSDYDLRGAHVLRLDAVVGLEVWDETVEDLGVCIENGFIIDDDVGSAVVVSLGVEVAKHVAIFFLKLLPFAGQRHSLADVGTGRQHFVEGIRRARL
jgi:hypothetical protein